MDRKDYIYSLGADLKAILKDSEDAVEDAIRMEKNVMSGSERKEYIKRIRQAKAKLSVVEQIIKNQI